MIRTPRPFLSAYFLSARFYSALVVAFAIAVWAPIAPAQFGAPPPPHKAHPPMTAESVAQGKMIFQGTCAVCHGIDGSGANGPNIQSIATTMGPEQLYALISTGVMGSGMPSFETLGEDKLWQVVDYVTSLSSHGAGAVIGNATQGKEVYDSNGCSSCHSIDGHGGDSGPDLSKVGADRAGTFLRDVLTDPGANLPLDTAGLQERSAYHAYEMYRVTLDDGKTVTGTRVNEDSFTIQLRDDKGELHSIEKFRVQKIEKVPGKSFMPSYKGKLSDTQLNDLVAYLSSLSGGSAIGGGAQ